MPITTDNSNTPIILCFSGLDPTGGAGIQADIESILSMNAHCTPIITTLTVQDSHNVHNSTSVDPIFIAEQTRAILEDMPVHAFKLGTLGSVKTIEIIASILQDYSDIPVVLDPVLSAGGGQILTDTMMQEAMFYHLFPLTTILTPNSQEAKLLADTADNLDACAQVFMDAGCEYVLITGAHENTHEVINTLYGEYQKLEDFYWQRLPHSYHGSGCTLAAATAALLAQGLDMFTAVSEAQEYTWESLQTAQQLGMGQYHPNRLFWAKNES